MFFLQDVFEGYQRKVWLSKEEDYCSGIKAQQNKLIFDICKGYHYGLSFPSFPFKTRISFSSCFYVLNENHKAN